MNYAHPQIRLVARRIPVLCTVYFVLFSFFFLFLLQRDVLAQAQYILSQGQSVFHPIVATLLSTALLLLLGFLVSFFLRWLPLRMKAFVWFPSFVLLGLLTCFRFPQFGDEGSAPGWRVVAVLFGVWLLAVVGSRLFPDSPKERDTLSAYAWPNALWLILFTAVTVSLSNTDAVTHHTLQSARSLSQRDYAAALLQARYERHPSSQLSAMTAYALSRQGQLGESLFRYPQPHGSQGLLPQLSDSLLFFNLPHAVGAHLGYRKGDRTTATLFFEAIARRPRVQPAARHYRLCALLLDRRTADFRQLLLDGDTLSLSLPLHYREALLLQQQLQPQSADTLVDDDLARQFLEFDSLRLLPGTPDEREFRCRQRYGGTYWAYYYFH